MFDQQTEDLNVNFQHKQNLFVYFAQLQESVWYIENIAIFFFYYYSLKLEALECGFVIPQHIHIHSRVTSESKVILHNNFHSYIITNSQRCHFQGRFQPFIITGAIKKKKKACPYFDTLFYILLWIYGYKLPQRSVIT